MIDIADIIQQIQDAVDTAGATVEVKDNDIIVTFPDGTIQVFEGAAHLMGSGATQYDDDMGDTIDLLDAQGVIPPVAMAFSVPELDEEPANPEFSSPKMDIIVEPESDPQDDDSDDYPYECDPEGGNQGSPESDPEAQNFSIQTNDWNGQAQVPSTIFDHFNGVVVDDLEGFNGEANGNAANIVNNAKGLGIHTPAHDRNWTGSFDYDGDNLDGTGTVGIHAIDHGKVDLKDINSDFAGNGQYKLLISDGEHDALVGSDGQDLIIGSSANEVLHGGQDHAGDILIGGAGNDVLFGMHGDVLIGDSVYFSEEGYSGDVTFDGSVGKDTFKFVDPTVQEVDILDFDALHDTVDLSGLGVDDSNIKIDDHDNGTATVTVTGETFDITIHYVGDITFDLLDGMITATNI